MVETDLPGGVLQRVEGGSHVEIAVETGLGTLPSEYSETIEFFLLVCKCICVRCSAVIFLIYFYFTVMALTTHSHDVLATISRW